MRERKIERWKGKRRGDNRFNYFKGVVFVVLYYRERERVCVWLIL